MKRLIWIDNIKCFAILLVILGHLIQFIYYPKTFDDNHLFRYIYSFHMPLFMVVSGILVGLKPINNIISTIKKRAIQLLIPFFTWGIFSSIINKKNIINSLFEIIKYPDRGLWFLWALFFIYLAFVVTIILNNRLRNFFISCLIIFLGLYYFTNYIINGLYGSYLITKFYFYYMIGYFFMNKRIFNSRLFKNKRFAISTLFLFIILAYFWKRIDFAFSPFNEFKFNKLFDSVFSITTALAGTISVILFFKTKTSNHIASYIGQRTLAIYAIHYFIIDIFKIIGNYNFYTIVFTFPLIIIGSLLLERLLSLNKFTSFFFLGKY